MERLLHTIKPCRSKRWRLCRSSVCGFARQNRPDTAIRQLIPWEILSIFAVQMVSWILKKILGSKNQRELRRLAPIVRRMNELDEQFKSLSDDELRAKTAAWKEELSKIPELEDQWNKLNEILPEAFAVVKNA